MKIYLIENKNKVDYKKELQDYGEVVILDSCEKDISKYKELFEDKDPKIIGVNVGIVEWKFPVEDIKKIKNLVGIASKSSWVFYLDVDYCKKNNIVVTNIAGANSQSVAEHAIWMMFSLAKKLPLQVESNFKTERTENTQGIEIVGKTAGIIGFGNIGSRIAKMANGLGMNVIYWSPKSRDKNYKFEELDVLLKDSDFVFNCIEAYDKTKNFFNKEKLNLLNKNSYFVSVMGGMGWGTEDNDYLVELANEGKIAGYSTENEHEPKYKLPKIKKGTNVLVTPSYAHYTKEAEERSEKFWVESIKGMATKEYVRRVV